MRLGGFLLFLTASTVFGGEYVVLAPSGNRFHVDRHEVDGPRTRLYTGGGYIEMETALIRGFEADPEEPPASKPPESSAATTPTPEQLADAAADRYGLPRRLVRGVMAAESAFQPRAISAKGAIGLMQLMPATAGTLGVNPYDPAQNVDAGTRYLRDLLIRYDGLLWHALAAYNAGPAAVDKYKGLPPYPETIRYVNRIDRDFRKTDSSN